MHRKKKLIIRSLLVTLTITILSSLIIFGSTNALFVDKTTQSRKNNYNTGLLSITAISKSDTISLDNTLPMSDVEGEALEPYTFTIKNNGNLDYTFDIQLLTTGNVQNIFDPQYIKIKVDDATTTTLSALTNSKIKTAITLAAQDTMDISIRIWLDENTPNSQIGKTFNSQLVISGNASDTTSNYGITAASYITNLYNNAAKTEVTNNNITYNYATSVSLMNDRLGGTTKDLNAGNIRYYGANPNNYVDIGHRTKVATTVNNWEELFPPGNGEIELNNSEDCKTSMQENSINDEVISVVTGGQYTTINDFCSTTTIPAGTPILYRIIGIFDNMLKLISTQSIGAYSWDTSDSNLNSGNGINQWGPSGTYEGADLMRLLNPGYENESINNSLYWTGDSGTCYNGTNNDTASCDFTYYGLTKEVRNKIATVTWHLGNFEYSNDMFANDAYSRERDAVNIGTLSDNITRQDRWIGKVGLMYPSDYGYATDLSICQTHRLITSTDKTGYEQGACKNNNWMFINKYSWTLSSSSLSHVWIVWPDGSMHSDHVGIDKNQITNWSDFAVYPSFYLNSEERIESGSGSKADPYIIK